MIESHRILIDLAEAKSDEDLLHLMLILIGLEGDGRE